MGYFGSALKSSATYLPSQVTEVFKQGRDFAVARLPCPGLKNVCALAMLVTQPSRISCSFYKLAYFEYNVVVQTFGLVMEVFVLIII